MDVSINGYQKQSRQYVEWVWFEGTTALKEGQGVCYNWDYGTATAEDGRRSQRVELPTILNARYFAGVAARAYSANSTGQLIEIFRPGSYCNILSRVANTIGVGRSTCIAGGTYAGYFGDAGFPGEGSAVAEQTVDRSSTAGTCYALLEIGQPSGLIEYVTPAAAGGAIVCMVGGVTYFPTAVTLAADATFTLADGVIPGQRKAFAAQADMTTNNIVVTVTSGVMGAGNADPSGALASITIDGDTDNTVVEWCGFDTTGAWVCQFNVGSVLA